MIIKILKNVRLSGAPSVKIMAGSIIELPDEVALAWIKSGHAEMVRMPDVETAVLPRYETAKIENKPVGKRR